MNLVIIKWTLGKDPEMKTTPSWVEVTKVSVATNKSWKDKEWNRQEKTTWHNVVAWKGLAKLLGNYFHKGEQILITGEIDNQTYEKDWQTRYTTNIIASNIEFVWNKKDKTETKVAKPKEEEISIDEIPF